ELYFSGVEDDLDVAGSLSDRCGATLRRRHEAAKRRAFIHDRVTDKKRVHVDRIVPFSGLELGICDGGVENFLDLLRRMLLGEAEKTERLIHILAADLIDDETHLVRRLARRALSCARHSSFLGGVAGRADSRSLAHLTACVPLAGGAGGRGR